MRERHKREPLNNDPTLIVKDLRHFPCIQEIPVPSLSTRVRPNHSTSKYSVLFKMAPDLMQNTLSIAIYSPGDTVLAKGKRVKARAELLEKSSAHICLLFCLLFSFIPPASVSTEKFRMAFVILENR